MIEHILTQKVKQIEHIHGTFNADWKLLVIPKSYFFGVLYFFREEIL